MFLRKCVVIVLPLVFCAVISLVLPLLGGLGFFANVLGGILLGLALALLLPLSGATRRREPFAGLLWIPAVLLLLTVAYQYVSAQGIWSAPLLNALSTTHGQTVLTECAFAAYMTTEWGRTRA